MTSDPLQAIRNVFFLECEELLGCLQDALSALASPDADGGDAVHIAFRAVHSIKGGAATLGLKALSDFAHAFETALDRLRDGTMSIAPDTADNYFRAADHLADLARVARDGMAPAGGGPEILAALGVGHPSPNPERGESGPGAGTDAKGTRLCRILFQPHPDFCDRGNEPAFILRALAALGSCVTHCALSAVPPLEDLDPQVTYLSWDILVSGDFTETDICGAFDFVEDLCTLEISAGAAPTQAASACGPLSFAPPAPVPPRPLAAMAPPQEAPASVRVDATTIDEVMNLIGEFVIAKSILARQLADAGLARNSDISISLEALATLSRELQDNVMKMRMQPIKPLFQRMARVLRETASGLGKPARLVIEGDATEVDRSMIEQLAEPLTHLIRNAVDHGLETPDERLAGGKPAEGRITLKASRCAGRIVVELRDDGRGIDRRRVRALAVNKGLIGADFSGENEDIDALLFLPGFSTASTVTGVSGRGVGMDVVKNAVQRMGGRVSISSKPTLGTEIAISLPLTLALLDGMVVREAGETLIVPVGEILETAALARTEVRAAPDGQQLAGMRGGYARICDVGAALGFRTAAPRNQTSIVILTQSEDGLRNALLVDAIIEQRQVVIKGLQENCCLSPGISAATILGDGRVALIIEPSEISGKAAPISTHQVSCASPPVMA